MGAAALDVIAERKKLEALTLVHKMELSAVKEQIAVIGY